MFGHPKMVFVWRFIGASPNFAPLKAEGHIMDRDNTNSVKYFDMFENDNECVVSRPDLA